ncbi:hypothetical protein C8P68_102541 [Mucilaginibacter yixingensis]|uniref:Uncharacterized protein n=1 Tax=Mucilaginibacter yixingensis TaxID=1295612 RepID=A0A2T5JD65_9SPHI|nr:hypothetical protein [Mucilaginibacter yixingensis]PTQ99712.1 hypothetical protein C8P68_102541 [Mucilaginibacter yixingensis]
MSQPSTNGRTNNHVKRSQLQKLVDNYYKTMKKVDVDGNVRDLDREKDARAIWFKKSDIDKLFADHNCTAENNDEFGLRIYFGVYGHGILDGVPDRYHNQQTAVLVATRQNGRIMDKDILHNDEDALGADGKGDMDPLPDDGSGTGRNHGKLCPPDTDCGSGIN